MQDSKCSKTDFVVTTDDLMACNVFSLMNHLHCLLRCCHCDIIILLVSWLAIKSSLVTLQVIAAVSCEAKQQANKMWISALIATFGSFLILVS